MTEKKSSYTAKDIQHLQDREHVRLRPGMYIGSVDEDGVQQLGEEIIANSIDEHVQGYGKLIKVSLNDMAMSVTDHGRGVPIDDKDGMCAATLVFTSLKAGGKFDSKSYKSSLGMNGVGASCVNFLSAWFTWEVTRDGQKASQKFVKGVEAAPPTFVPTTETQTGTTVSFAPDPEIFGTVQISPTRVQERCKDLAMLNAGLTIEVSSKAEAKSYCYPEGVKAFVQDKGMLKNPFHFRDRSLIKLTDGTESEVQVEIAMQFYEDKYDENIMSFCNNGSTIYHGSHVQGYKTALTKTLNKSAEEAGLLKSTKRFGLETFTGEDLREGLKAIVSISMPNPVYSGQTKQKLSSPEAGSAVEMLLSKHLKRFFDQNPVELKALVRKFETARKAREAAKKAREAVRKSRDSMTLPGKLMDAWSDDRLSCELFISEGSSPTSHMKEARDSKIQGILPLRGKPMNAFGTPTLADVLKNEEVHTIITAIGTGIMQDFKMSDARYGKIILFPDADSDGSHIACLLLGTIERLMPALIDAGMVYLVDAPLYRLKSRKGKAPTYLKDDAELLAFQKKNPDWESQYDVTRFKGLGEASKDELYDHCLNPVTRTLRQITRTDPLLAAKTFKGWLSTDMAAYRREEIYAKADKVSWEDFI